MKNLLFRFLFATSFSILVFSCKNYKEPEFRNIETARVSKLGLKESTVILGLLYYNPNNSRLQVKEASGDAWIEGNYVGKFSMDTLIHIPANGEFQLPVTLIMDMSHFIGNAATSYLNEKVNVKIEGKAKVGKAGFFINYPIHYEGLQNISELLKL
ncbi:MAG TPA: LEA type 2 family protein [Chitinophagaceae bacterium]|nr:LEA type 2 family protein [Chitinophagaceae bacterium]